MKEARNGTIHLCLSLLLGVLVGGVGAGTGLYMGPYFPSPQTRNITVHQNTVAYLPCTVKQLGDKSVSWVRKRDADILTVDKYTFVRDERLTVHFTPESDTWTLVIKYVQERDAGTYECQISTEPKMSMFVHLNVIVPQVKVSGAADKYVRSGSTARLECTVSSTVQLPDYIFWYHSGDRLLEYDHPRITISVSRRGGQGSEMSVTSTLIISNARPSDAGNYTCLPSNLHNATTILHVLNDEHPAAMHTGRVASVDPIPAWGVLLVVCLVLIASRSPIGEHLHHVLPHVVSHNGGDEREGDKDHRTGGVSGGQPLGRIDTCMSLTSTPKDSRFYSLRERRQSAHAVRVSCQRAVLWRAIDSHPVTPTHCSLVLHPPLRLQHSKNGVLGCQTLSFVPQRRVSFETKKSVTPTDISPRPFFPD